MTLAHLTPQRPRVCLVAPEFIGPFPNGGVGTACYWEASTLADAGLDVTVLYTGPTDRETPDHWERTYNAAGHFTYVDLWRWAAHGPASAVEQTDHPCAEARTSELVFRFLRQRDFDLLLFQEFLGHGARTLQARRAGEALTDVPTVVTLHSCRQWIYEGMQRVQISRDDMAVDFLERESARLADHVVAPSRHMAEWVAAHWPLTAPATVIPYCYDRSIEPAPARVDHAGPFTHLVFFGRLETRKGLHLLCRALASSEAARGPVRRVTFLGKRSTVEGRPSDDFIRTTLGHLTDVDIEIIDTLGSFEALAWLERQPHTLVVAPSLVDNLPYAVIELFTRRIPFISTRIGGIPEIAGAANVHLMAEATVEGLAATLVAVHEQGRLTTDYGAGYSAAWATARHVDYVRSLLRWRPETQRPDAEAFDIVVVDHAHDVDEVKRRLLASDPTARAARFLSWPGWLQARTLDRPAIFVSADITPNAGATRRLLNALRDRRVSAATSYYTTDGAAGPTAVAPLGASLECGWAENVFGGPCLAVWPSAFDVLAAEPRSSFRFWPAFAALACAGLDVALVPVSLYACPASDARDHSHEVEAVIEHYRRDAAGRLDLGWTLQHARSGLRRAAWPASTAPDRGLYEHLLSIPDRELMSYCGLTPAGPADHLSGDLRGLHRRISTIVAGWRVTAPRVFVHGAGEHTRVLLALEPDLGRFIGGFIDRRPVSQFLGRPCVRPEAMTPAMADVILYSSREFERDMHTRLAHLPVEHVLLYSDVPRNVEETTATRLRRRLGHTDAQVDGLRAMYRPPAWATGFISGGDTEFLLELVAGLEPHSVLELGVASGASSAALLFALDQLPGAPDRRHLLSCDVRPSCYFDPQRPTGSAVGEMYPAHRATWTLDTNTDARRLAASLAPQSFDLLFIDANHSHPWPLIDLLHLAPLARRGAWIALHDIELPVLNPKYQVHGPQWLFDAWPFNKVHGVGASRNIGAVQLPDDLGELVPMALALVEREWEHAPGEWDVDLPPVFAPIHTALAPRLARAARTATR